MRRADRAPQYERTDRVLAAIRQHGPTTPAHLRAVLGLGPNPLADELARLLAEGAVEQSLYQKAHVYWVPDEHGTGNYDLPSPRAVLESFRDRARRRTAA